MSKLVKSYKAQEMGQHLVRIYPIETAPHMYGLESEQQEDPIETARRTAEQLVDEAKVTADQLKQETLSWQSEYIAQVKIQADEIFQTAKNEGFQAGYQEGIQTAQTEIEQNYQTSQNLLESAIQARKQFLNNSESFLISVALSAAEKIIRMKIDLDQEIVIGLVQACLQEVHQKGMIEIRVHPDDYQTVLMKRNDLQTNLTKRSELVIIPDASLSKGGCFLFTEQGSLDARVETGIEEIEKALKELTGGWTN